MEETLGILNTETFLRKKDIASYSKKSRDYLEFFKFIILVLYYDYSLDFGLRNLELDN